MRTQSFLLLTVSLLLVACGSSTQAQAVPISLDGETNPQALAAAESGELGKPAVVFFHAQWCHICQKARPEMAALAESYSNEIAIVRMDIDAVESRAAVERYQVAATPTFVLFSGEGNVLATIPGWPGRERMEMMILQMLGEGRNAK